MPSPVIRGRPLSNRSAKQEAHLGKILVAQPAQAAGEGAGGGANRARVVLRHQRRHHFAREQAHRARRFLERQISAGETADAVVDARDELIAQHAVAHLGGGARDDVALLDGFVEVGRGSPPPLPRHRWIIDSYQTRKARRAAETASPSLSSTTTLRVLPTNGMSAGAGPSAAQAAR